MSRFTTEHPLGSQPSLFDAKKYPKLSFVCSSLVLALTLTPFLYGYGIYCALTDGVICTDEPPLPNSWADFFWEVSELFLFCLFCACLFVSAYRLLSWCYRKVRHASS
jgi:hypothetical protein